MSLIKNTLLMSLLLSCMGGYVFAGGSEGSSSTEGSLTTAEAEPVASTPVSEAQLKLGKRAFIRCQACHTLAEGEAHRVGPNLHGLFSSTAGKKEGFEYSEALGNSGVQWTDESLRAWLKSPSSFIPGNKMAFAGVPNDKEMNALMTYLKETTK